MKKAGNYSVRETASDVRFKIREHRKSLERARARQDAFGIDCYSQLIAQLECHAHTLDKEESQCSHRP